MSGEHGGYFVDDMHALYVGWVAMRLQMAGVKVVTVADSDGNYMPLLRFSLPAVGQQEAVDVVVGVPGPPPEWEA